MTDQSAILQPYFPSELLTELKAKRARRSAKSARAPLVIAEITKGTPRSPDPSDGALLVLGSEAGSLTIDAKIEAQGLAQLDLLTIAADQDAGIELERNRQTIKRFQPHILIEGTAADAQLAQRYLPHYREPRDLGDRLRYFEPIELRSLTAVHGRVEGAKTDIQFPAPRGDDSVDLNNENGSYLWLAAFVKIFRPLRILEIGRGQGNSLRALAHELEARAQLDSYDVIPCGNVLNQTNIEAIVYDGIVETIEYEPYDFVFVDLDLDMGLERRIYRKMKDCGFLGVSVWNGIRDQNRPRLSTWWDKLDSQKLDVSATNCDLGTGLIWFN